MKKPKIIQIFVASVLGPHYNEIQRIDTIYGLSDKSLIYTWDETTGKWLLFSQGY